MSTSTSKEEQRFVKAVANGKNVKAMKSLEKIIQIKCADKIKQTITQEHNR